MGRFICKAFGIPTWGVREPGHAAMARWTPHEQEGWVVCLGAAMPFAWWEDQCGLYFQLETTARKACAIITPDDPYGVGTNVTYGEKVMMMEWIADILGEPQQQVMRECLVDPNALWRSLSLMSRRRLSSQKKEDTSSSAGRDEENVVFGVTPQMERRLRLNATKADESIQFDKGTIYIPAASCDKEKHNGNVIIMDSFLGGKQLFLNQDGTVAYTLTDSPGGKYELSCRFVTVHDEKVKPPLQLTIEAGETCADVDDNGWQLVQGFQSFHYNIALPYTKGMWEESTPIVVELPAEVSSCKISLTRDKSAMGLALKDIKLVPVTAPT